MESNLDPIYMYHFRNNIIPKLGTEIPYFNLLFFVDCHCCYVLDELVKILKLKQIKELNARGYQIGKLISFMNGVRPPMIEIKKKE